MVVIVVCMAVLTLLDAFVLLLDPSRYRRCMRYVEEEVGSVWMVANGFAFMAPGLAFLVDAVVFRTAIMSALVGFMSVLVGLFFALGVTERFAWLGGWWRSRPNAQYRMAGIAGIVLSMWILLLALELPRN
jgi:hypothetical protein